MLLEEL